MIKYTKSQKECTPTPNMGYCVHAFLLGPVICEKGTLFHATPHPAILSSITHTETSCLVAFITAFSRSSKDDLIIFAWSITFPHNAIAAPYFHRANTTAQFWDV